MVSGDQPLYARLSGCVVVTRDFHTADDTSVSVNYVSPILMFHSQRTLQVVRAEPREIQVCQEKSEKVQHSLGYGAPDFRSQANSSAPAGVKVTKLPDSCSFNQPRSIANVRPAPYSAGLPPSRNRNGSLIFSMWMRP